MRKSMLVSAAFILILSMVVSACSGNSDKGNENKAGNENKSGNTSQTSQPDESGGTPDAKEPITITMLVPEPGAAVWNDFQDSAIQQEIKKATGVTLQIIEADSDKFNVMLASGDLPDMIRGGPAYIKQLIEGGNVVPIDDLLQSNGQNILKAVPKTLAFSKKFWSNGTDKTYFLPPQIGQDRMPIENGIGAFIRWDYYKELNYPAINNEDELLDVLAAMAKNHPTTEDGKKVYGVSGWTDWGNWSYQYTMGSLYGNTPLTGEVAGLKWDTNELNNMLTDTEGAFWKSVKYFNKANRLGILDPDALLQKFGDFGAKATSGQLLSGPSIWSLGDFNSNNAKDGKGFISVPMDWGFQWSGSNQLLGFSDKLYGITKNAKAPGRIMDLMNYLWSFDGARTLLSGVKGVHWDEVDGKAVLKQETIDLQVAGGDSWSKTFIGQAGNLVGINAFTLHPEDGAPLDLFQDPAIYASRVNALQKDFSDHYGVKYPAEVFMQKLESGKNKNQKDQNTLAMGLMPSPPDDIKRMEAKLKDLAARLSAECVLTKSDEQFAEKQKKAIAAYKDAGADKVFEWYAKAWEDAKTQSATIN
ncbi:hypothetical protein [Paenibacillus nasutitermitis]|uniref:ABC transporter substrate-binding protein n=1 Tax=Paenibacillus nasutitermitis TaxID=1652958 RepID=A0A916YKL5_9BACL|nr:hypothetical protein [Paenibacillus nasutitermitis]GGD49711.1 hypothetical protein GCM10010911_04050 [Paenibacillus nasutitermitis]